METGLDSVRESDVEALRAFQPGPSPPDLVRGVAGPLWASLHNLERAGAEQVITIVPGGLRWGLLLPPG